jgi:hypothetical protein
MTDTTPKLLNPGEIGTLRQFVIGAASPPITRDELHALCNTAEAFWKALEWLEGATVCIEAGTKILPDYNPNLYPGTLLKRCRAFLSETQAQGGGE